jgi:hypothetical protein
VGEVSGNSSVPARRSSAHARSVSADTSAITRAHSDRDRKGFPMHRQQRAAIEKIERLQCVDPWILYRNVVVDGGLARVLPWYYPKEWM